VESEIFVIYEAELKALVIYKDKVSCYLVDYRSNKTISE